MLRFQSTCTQIHRLNQDFFIQVVKLALKSSGTAVQCLFNQKSVSYKPISIYHTLQGKLSFVSLTSCHLINLEMQFLILFPSPLCCIPEYSWIIRPWSPDARTFICLGKHLWFIWEAVSCTMYVAFFMTAQLSYSHLAMPWVITEL